MPCSAMRSKNVRQAPNNCSAACLRFDPEQRQQGAADPFALGRVGNPFGDRLSDLCARGLLVVRFGQAGSLADHLAKCPEADALTIGGAAPAVPVDALDQPVDVLEELPREPALADTRGANNAHHAQPFLAPGRVEKVLEQAHLFLSAGKRRLQRFRPIAPAHFRHYPQGTPRGNRRLLALERLRSGRFIGDRRAGGPLGRLSDQHRPPLRGALQPAGRVHEVPRDHALVGGTERHRRLTGEDAGTCLDALAQGWDGVDQVECGAHGALGVVLVRSRRSPDGHHGIADELLDRAAIAFDDLARQVEVARQRVAHVLRVALRGEGRETDEIGEQDADQPPLGRACVFCLNGPHGRRTRWSGTGSAAAAQRGAALGTELGAGQVGKAAVGAARVERRAALHAELGTGQVLSAAT